jgi:iron(III) transport system substrate-binding protein
MANGKWKMENGNRLLRATGGLILTFSILLSACNRAPATPTVVLYTSVDEPVARKIVGFFQTQTGVQVIIVTDTEATKSVGLAERIRAEKANPQADVFWSNEPFHAINLAEEGLLTAYNSPQAADIPPVFKDPKQRWACTGLRARVLAVSVALEGSKHRPASIFDLLGGPEGSSAIARPTSGTTGGHVAALYTILGPAKARQYFRDLHNHETKLLGGNSIVAEKVAQGTLWMGLTDNDDCYAVKDEVEGVHMVLPDQNTFGTLMIPTTVGLVAGAKHPGDAKRLIDFLLSKRTDKMLMQTHFALTTVRDPTAGGTIRPMQIDYPWVARAMPQAVREATALLEGRAEGN